MPDAPLPDVEILRREAERLAARADAPRVQRMELNGQVFWLKIVKERGALLRLRKGSARALADLHRAEARMAARICAICA